MDSGSRVRKNDQGISLVELIISIAILSIIVLPILSAFVVATRTNAKALNKFCAVNAAENIMEGLENESLEDIADSFDPGSSFSLFDVLDNNYCELVYDTATSSYVQATKRLEGDHKYYFYVPRIDSDGKEYTAVVTLDARTNEAGSKYEKYNKDNTIADISSLDLLTDGICTKVDNIAELLNSINSLYNLSQEITTSDLDKITREIYVDIDKDTVTARTSVKVTYRYSFRDATGAVITFPEPGSIYEQSYSDVIFDNSDDTTNELRDVYLMYKPWYTSTKNFPFSTDKIIVNNQKGLKCNIRMIKQILETASASELTGYESAYRTIVYVNDPCYTDADGNKRSNIGIATNLGLNLAIEDDKLHPDINKVANQVTYVLNNTNANQTEVKKVIAIGKLNEKEAEDRLFDVKVDVYPKNTSITDIGVIQPIVTMTGGMSD